LEELLGGEKLAELDLFDRQQLAIVFGVCRQARTLSEAGRVLYSVSRHKRRTANDADRLRKYLARFGLKWEQMRAFELQN
jgi:transcriptional regulatory protein RtcR